VAAAAASNDERQLLLALKAHIAEAISSGCAARDLASLSLPTTAAAGCAVTVVIGCGGWCRRSPRGGASAGGGHLTQARQAASAGQVVQTLIALA
jgi:hypothetical protein